MPSSFAFSKFRLSVLFVSLCQTVVERLRSERNLACPAGAQEGRHQGFHPLIFTPFLRYPDANQRPAIASKKGTAEDFFYRRGAQCAPMSLPVRSVRFLAATHTGSSTQAQHNSVAQRFYWVAVHGTVGVNWKKSVSVQSTPGDSVPLRGSCAPDRWC